MSKGCNCMSIHPDTHERITKLQRDVEEIKEELQDQWHHRRGDFEQRVRKCLENDNNAIALFFEIDAERTMDEIETALAIAGKRVPHVSLWRASKKLESGGLIKKVGVKGKSPVYAKRPWVKALDMDNYVRKEILNQEVTLG